ncbi:rRNA maturation RNase YbeY [Pseudooceanicola sp. 216_PA32_1]|uniref:Endoribonuclease YbeY n=1 Tax=Pseudooceanicola pacificus TaxID=2676438 RepID=A0A844W4P2_9RHOB|nr:rRNA maturation RNase YbeY [Pseudooceanicola pacificus]MWB79216.1 rRNA maturation RNase YbeY [Pseudooceanicola pacificus]
MTLVDCLTEDPRWDAAGLEPLAEAAARAALAGAGLDPDDWAISLLACDDARIAVLNAEFRGKPVPTNVLSWPSDDRAAQEPGATPDPPDPEDAMPGEPAELGDIAISYDTCLREAQAGGLALGDHATHLIVHAVLHLLGYDHERDEDATLMETLETAILGKMGLHDPYAPMPDV